MTILAKLRHPRILLPLMLTGAVSTVLSAQTPRRALDSSAVAEIATLLLLEDTRTFDSLAIARALSASHPEVRRRALMAVAHINDKRGIPLVRAFASSSDTALAATAVFAVGQLRDTLTIGWLDTLLSNPRTPPTVRTEAACALGKIKTVAARDALWRYLATVSSNATTDATIGEALLAIGRSTARGNLTAILRWTTSANEEIRWRAAWALFRPRDPASVAKLIELSSDRSAEVRYWAVRGLVRAQADSAGVAAGAEARLISATRDSDLRVRTEAIRALGTYNDSTATAELVSALRDAESWIAVSAAEGLRGKAAWTTPALMEATKSTSCALRVTAMRTLLSIDSTVGRAAARDVATDAVPYCQNAAATVIRDTLPRVPQGPRPPRTAPVLVARPIAEYKAIVERWIVPAYQGKPLPRARWTTQRGAIELELYAGDAPLAMDLFAQIMDNGSIIGTEFSRVVPDFVDQQATIRGAALQRDEVNRHRLTRGNLAWASAGLDTGRPGYTLNHTPQPHNEGDFTSLGRVVAGQDAVDRTQLGDRILTAAMVRAP